MKKCTQKRFLSNIKVASNGFSPMTSKNFSNGKEAEFGIGQTFDSLSNNTIVKLGSIQSKYNA